MESYNELVTVVTCAVILPLLLINIDVESPALATRIPFLSLPLYYIREYIAGRLEEKTSIGVRKLFKDGRGIDAVKGLFERVAMLLYKYLNQAGSQLLLQTIELLWGNVWLGHILESLARARSVPKKYWNVTPFMYFRFSRNWSMEMSPASYLAI